MGAGGSTAASCSSLDLGNGQVPDKYRYYRQQGRHQQLLHEQRLQKYKLQRQAGGRGAKSGYLKQSSSHFDLTSCDMRTALGEEDFYLRDNPRRPYGGLEQPTQVAAAREVEAYNLTNSDMARPQPPPTVMVLPPLPVGHAKHPALGVKKSNAGVASRILHQRQQQQQRRSGELKKFSDSLPSLNNILLVSPRHEMAAINQHPVQHHQRISPSLAYDCRADRTKQSSSPSKHQQHRQKQYLMKPSNHRSSSAIQQKQVTTANLVIDERPYRGQQSQHHWQTPQYTQAQSGESALIKRQHQQQQQQQHQSKYHHSRQNQSQMMKRATSLSSLHNLNQSPHLSQHHYHPRDDCPVAVNSNANMGLRTRSSANPHHYHQSHHHQHGRSPRPPSINSACAATSINTTADLESQYLPSQHHRGQSRPLRSGCDLGANQSTCDVLSGQYRLPPQTSPAQVMSGGNAAALRKNYKYKPAPSAGLHLARGNRYKSKQQHQPPQPPQGCPVLPPMPRSQSLHELIQLRKTENGQRMRTTGTLRGPFDNDAPANKVNLVAELLENRRQQRQTEEGGECQQQQQQQQGQQNSETLLSQSSSTDDGIHDVSLTGNADQQATKQSFSPNNRSSSISSQECDKLSASSSSAASRQRIFKPRQTAAGATAAAAAAFNKSTNHQRLINDSQQDGQSDRPGGGRHQSRNSKLNSNKQHKSTLKRSASHSALQHRSCDISDPYDQDGDESDDLNELARFLYQFKQRQVKNQAAAAAAAAAPGAQVSQASRESDNVKPTEDARCVMSRDGLQEPLPPPPPPSGDGTRRQVNSNFQQSPNSTTSSSGFASSSTCTAHSISSGRGDKFQSSVSSASSREDVAEGSGARKLASRKKYPAPPRPDTAAAANPSGGKSKNHHSPIGGKMKGSSSLLSIVDELPLTATGPLCGANKADYQSRDPAAAARLDGRKDVDEFKIDQQERAKQQQQQYGNRLQLERLQRHANLRQMSRSELALNHLTSSVACLDVPSGGCAKRKLHKNEIMHAKQKSAGKHTGGESGASIDGSSNGKKPYTNRLFNLIRRISSDKSEAAAAGPDSGSCGGGSVASAASERRPSATGMLFNNRAAAAAAGGQHAAGELAAGGCWAAIDGRQEEINQTSEMMNSGYPNKSGHPEQRQQCADAASGRPLSDCDHASGVGSGQQQQQQQQQQRTRNANAHLATSESLCDLNFDCDFELIKKCGSSTSERAARHGNGTEHNEPPGGRLRACKESAKSKHNGQRGDRPIIDSSSSDVQRENNNNWRLVPTSSLLGLTHFSRGPGQGAVNGAAPSVKPMHLQQYDNDDYNNSGAGGSYEKSAGGKTKFATKGGVGGSCDVRGETPRAKEDKPSAAQQGKPKWSASSWFLGGSSGGSSSKKSKKGAQEKCKSAAAAADNNNNSGSSSKSYLARLMPNSGGTGGSRSSSVCSKSKQTERDKRASDAAAAAADMISEADQLLVELDQSLDLVSGTNTSSRQRQRRRSSRLASDGGQQVPWWQQVSSKITEEEALMLHEAQLNAATSSGDENSLSDSDREESDDADGASADDCEEDNDDADYASINRALINETFDADLLAANRPSELDEPEEPGSPSDSFTFSAHSSPSPSPPPPLPPSELKSESPRAQVVANLAPALREIDGGNITTNGLSKQQAGGGARSAQDKQRLAPSERGDHKPAGVLAHNSSKFTYNRAAKTTTTTTATTATPPPAATSTASTNGACTNDEQQRERALGAKLGGGGNNGRSNLERGVCRPAASQDSKSCHAKGAHITNQMAEADGKKLLVPSADNKIVAPSENSDTFTRVSPQGVAVATANHQRHLAAAAAHATAIGQTTSQVVRGGVTQMKGGASQKVDPIENEDDGARCMTNIVRARDNAAAAAAAAKKPAPIAGQHLNVAVKCRTPSNDVIGGSGGGGGGVLVANGNRIASVGDDGASGCSNCNNNGGRGGKSSGSPGEEKEEEFNDPLSCLIHGRATCCACCCVSRRGGGGSAHSTGQGEAQGNLKQQQLSTASASSSGQRQLDTNSVELCARGYDTESDNGKPRCDGGCMESGGKFAAMGADAATTAPVCDCARVVIGRGGCCCNGSGASECAAGHKLACRQPVAARQGGAPSDNGLSSAAGHGSCAAVAARTKSAHHESLVCRHRPVTAREAAAAAAPSARAAGGNNKLIIQKNSCLSCAHDGATCDSPLANEKQQQQQHCSVQAAAAKSATRVSQPAAAAVLMGCCPSRANGCEPPAANASSSSAAVASPKVTYYHYSHGMKNFAPNPTAAASSGKPRAPQAEAMDRPNGAGCCGRAAAGGSDQIRNLGTVQQRAAAAAECSCMITTSGQGAASGGNNYPACRESEKKPGASSSSCKTACHYHLGNSSSHDSATAAAAAASACHGPGNEDVKGSVAAACCSPRKPSSAVQQALQAKNKAPDSTVATAAGRKPMTAGRDDNDQDVAGLRRHTRPAKMTTDHDARCKVVSPARNDVACHCCQPASSPAGQTNDDRAAQLLQAHAKSIPVANTPPAATSNNNNNNRCNPICRSNSELMAVDMREAGKRSAGLDRRVGEALFGRLRNSLLGNQQQQQQRGTELANRHQNDHLLGSSQVSLASHYDAASAQHLLQNMLIPSGGGASSGLANDFDDNFILKRKTPNAGLKSRC